MKILIVLLVLLTACFAGEGEPTVTRPVLPDLDDLVVTVAPAAPYMPADMPGSGEWPTRPITLIVPFLPGGDTNMYARMFAPHLAEILGQPVYVMNVDGGSGTEGAMFVSNAAPDGYTMLFYHTGNLFTNVLTGAAELNYFDFDIAAVGMHCNANVLVVHRDTGIRTAQEFLAHIRANPGSLYVATTITGFSFKLLRLAELAGDFRTTPIHVGGGGMMAPSILAGHTQVGYNIIAIFAPYIESGELVPLWLAADGRNPLLPDVPTMSEVGIDGGHMGRSYFFALPPGTSPEILQRVSNAVEEIVRYEPFQAEIREVVGLGTYFVPFDRARAYISDMWASVIHLKEYMR